MDRIEIPTNYILSLEEDCTQIINFHIFRGNSLIGNNIINNTKRSRFQRIREDVHSPFLIKGNYYNGEREVEETRILIYTSASCVKPGFWGVIVWYHSIGTRIPRLDGMGLDHCISCALL